MIGSGGGGGGCSGGDDGAVGAVCANGCFAAWTVGRGRARRTQMAWCAAMWRQWQMWLVVFKGGLGFCWWCPWGLPVHCLRHGLRIRSVSGPDFVNAVIQATCVAPLLQADAQALVHGDEGRAQRG